VGIKGATSDLPPVGELTLQPVSNVTRICRCVSQVGSDNSQQITYYQSGIGTQNILSKIVGGATGVGLSENIREAYEFLCANYNYDSGDEIFLIGFSRGAFTARSIAAFINDVGLLTPEGLKYFYPIFEDWENQLKKGYVTHFPDYPFPGNPDRPNLFTNPKAYVDKLLSLKYTTPNVRIKAVAVYDTVGMLHSLRHHFFFYTVVD
jgi:hypothetical protein